MKIESIFEEMEDFDIFAKSEGRLKSVENTAQNIAEPSKSVGRENKNGERENVREHGTNDEFRRIQEESRRKPDGTGRTGKSKELDENLSRRLSRAFRNELRNRGYRDRYSDGILNLDDGNGNSFVLYENVDVETFRDFFEISRAYTENGELVDLHPAATTEDTIGYEDCACYLSDDGRQGFAITNTGDLVNVFNSAPEHRGFLRSIRDVINQNAKTLDCYASVKQDLPVIYSKIFG